MLCTCIVCLLFVPSVFSAETVTGDLFCSVQPDENGTMVLRVTVDTYQGDFALGSAEADYIMAAYISIRRDDSFSPDNDYRDYDVLTYRRDVTAYIDANNKIVGMKFDR